MEEEYAFERQAKVLEANSTSSTIDPFGKVRYGALEFETKILDLTVDFNAAGCLQLYIKINSTSYGPLLLNNIYGARASVILDHFKTYKTILDRGALDVQCAILNSSNFGMRALVLLQEKGGRGLAAFTRIGIMRDWISGSAGNANVLSKQLLRPCKRITLL